MSFNKHYELEGKHAFLSASNYRWLKYDKNKLIDIYNAKQAVERGTRLHEYAATAIRLKRKQPKTKETVCMHINDAIGFRMEPEVVLKYSLNCFGTADAICFRNKTLRIHDLKTGETPAKMDQLMIYAALYCLEYDVNPSDIKIILRIYQFNSFIEYEPEPEEIKEIMDIIIEFDGVIDQVKRGEI